MRLGVIGYANNQGIGTMTQDLVQMFNAVHLVTDAGDKGNNLSTLKTKDYLMCKAWKPTDDELKWLFDRVDAVVTVETDWKCNLASKAKAAGKRAIMIPMIEWFDPIKYQGFDSYICTTPDCFTNINFAEKVYIPWPLMTEKFPFKLRGKAPNLNFIHNAGFGGMNYRKGTQEVVRAWKLVKNPDVRLHVRSQRPLDYFEQDVQDIVNSDKRISFVNKDFPNMIDIYEFGDIYLYPARYDGQSLVAEEAMLCGFPTFTTDAMPMNEFTWDKRFNISVVSKDPIKIYGHNVAVNICNVQELADKIEWSVNEDLTEVSIKNRQFIEERFSWKTFKAEYEKAFFGLK